MKAWNNCEIVELNIEATAEGGKNVQAIDKYWTDNKTGDLYASYASGGDTEGEGFDVIKNKK